MGFTHLFSWFYPSFSFMKSSLFFSRVRALFTATFLCRCTGAAREILMASLFGSSPSVAAFSLAYRTANQISRLFGEQALRASLIPLFTQMRQENEQHALLFFLSVRRSCLRIVSLFLFCAALLLGIPLLCTLEKSSTRELLQLILLLLPTQLAATLSFLNGALLNCNRRFFLPGITPSLINFIWIGTVLLTCSLKQSSAMRILALSLCLAFFLQWFCTALPLRKLLPSPSLATRDFAAPFFSRWSLIVLGVGANSLNLILDGVFARIADLSGPAYLNYALRLQQAPLSLCTLTFSSVLLPHLSTLLARGEEKRGEAMCMRAIQSCLGLLITGIGILFSTGSLLVQLIYERGAFGPQDSHETTRCLWAYVMGLIPQSFVLLMTSQFYAREQYLPPLRATLLSLAINCCCNALFIFRLQWGVVSIAFSTTLSYWFSAWYLLHTLALPSQKLFSFLASRSLLSLLGMTLCIGAQLWFFGELSPFFFLTATVAPPTSLSLTLQKLSLLPLSALPFLLFSFFSRKRSTYRIGEKEKREEREKDADL